MATISWQDLAFPLDKDLADEVREAWRWLIPEPWRPILCSIFGGIFLEKQGGGVYWLECGTGEIQHVADTESELHALLAGPRDEAWQVQVDDWFLCPLVEQLHEAGKIPGPGQCYGATILPVFEGGAYTVANMFVVSAREWLTLTADIHRQLASLPDGASVRITVR